MAGPTAPQDFLKAENVGLRMLLEQAGIDAKALLGQGGIIAAQSLRTATSIEHGRQAIESRLLAMARAHDLLLQVRWSSASLAHIVQGATEPYDSQGEGKFTIEGPDFKIASGAVIALAMTLNELCTNTTKFGALSVPAGRIGIAWTIDEKTKRLRLTWTESGG